MTVLTKPPVLSVPLWGSGEGPGGRGRPPGIWAAPSPGTAAARTPPRTHPRPESSPARAGLPGGWRGARLAAERGQRGGASGGGAEDVAGRPGREPDRGPEGEGTPPPPLHPRAGAGWARGGGVGGGGWGCRAGPELESGRWGRGGHGAGQCQAASCPPSGPGLRGEAARARGRAGPWWWPEEGRRARRGPGLSRRKTSQGLQFAALSFFFSLLLGRGEKKKQCFLWRRMQKGCRILTISCTRPSSAGCPGRGRARGHGGWAGGEGARCLSLLDAGKPAGSWAGCRGGEDWRSWGTWWAQQAASGATVTRAWRLGGLFSGCRTASLTGHSAGGSRLRSPRLGAFSLSGFPPPFS